MDLGNYKKFNVFSHQKLEAKVILLLAVLAAQGVA